MRPKIVLLVFALGLCLLVVVGILRNPSTPTENQNPIVPGETPGSTSALSTTSAIGQLTHSPTGILATTVEQDIEKQRRIDLDSIEEALAKAPGDEGALFAIASRLENPDAEVREAARDAAMHLGNTNILPVLVSVMQRSADAREKVALMDVIQYLQLPDTVEPEPNDPATTMTNRIVRPRTPRGSQLRPPAPAAANPQGQPGN